MSGRCVRVAVAGGVLTALLAATTPAVAATDESQQQWNLAAGSAYGVRAAEAWTVSTGSGATIAMLDSGLTPHPDLTGSWSTLHGGNVVAGYDFISNQTYAADGDGWDADPTDAGRQSDASGNDIGPYAHGEQTAGVAAALKNGTGVVGVAPEATIVPVRVMGDQWSIADDADLAAAIRWGAGIAVPGVPTNAHPADVLSLSIAVPWPTCPTELQDAIDAAVAHDVAVVVAAGNTWTDSGPRNTIDDTAPATCDNIIRVTASTAAGVLEQYSNVGTAAVPATIAAPGTIRSLCPLAMPSCQDGYIDTIGTSMSVPHVSGVVALLRAARPELSVAEITTILTETATPFSTSCAASVCGAGVVNAPAALSRAMAGVTPPVTPSPSPTPSPAVTLTTPRVSGTAAVGQTLTVAAAAQPSTARLSMQWFRDGVAIPGATGRSYRATVADLDATVKAQVVATLGPSIVKRLSAAVTIRRGTLTKRRAPRIIGTARVGLRLTARHGAWSPKPSAFRYQWLRDGRKIAGATTAHYRPTWRDKGHALSVRVRVKRSGYASRSATSALRRVR